MRYFDILAYFVVRLILSAWRQFCCSVAVSWCVLVMVEPAECLVPFLYDYLGFLMILARVCVGTNCESTICICFTVHLYFLSVSLSTHFSLPALFPMYLSSPICLLFALAIDIYPRHLTNYIPHYYLENLIFNINIIIIYIYFHEIS